MRSLALVVACAALILLPFVVYRGLWDNAFYKDDYEWLTIGMDLVASRDFLLTPDPVNSEYVMRLTQRVLFALTYLVAGLNPAGYYIVSLFLHGICSMLVFLLLYTMHRHSKGHASIALFGALFFATTSCHEGAIVWMSSQATLLVTAATLGLLIFIVRNEVNLLRPRVVLVVAVGFAVALFSKKTAAVFPLLLAGYVLFPGGEAGESTSRRFAFRRASAVFGMLAAMSIGTLLVAKYGARDPKLANVLFPAANDTYGVSIHAVHNMAGAVLGCFVPAPVFDGFGSAIPFQVASLLVLALFLGVAYLAPRQRRGILFGLAWMMIAALPASLFNYRQYDPQQFTASRYYYLPMVGASVAVVGVLHAGLVKFGLMRWRVLVVVFLGVAHAALHSYEIDTTMRAMRDYTRSHQAFIDNTLEMVQEQAPAGAVVFARNWPFAEERLDRIGRLFFEPEGFVLRSASELGEPRDHKEPRQLPHYLLDWNPTTRHARLVPLSPPTPNAAPEAPRP